MTKPLAQEAQELVRRCRETAEKATPGPWRTYEDDFSPRGVAVEHGVVIDRRRMKVPSFWKPAEDADFIAAARTDVPALCDMIDRLVAELNRCVCCGLSCRNCGKPDYCCAGCMKLAEIGGKE